MIHLLNREWHTQFINIFMQNLSEKEYSFDVIQFWAIFLAIFICVMTALLSSIVQRIL